MTRTLLISDMAHGCRALVDRALDFRDQDPDDILAVVFPRNSSSRKYFRGGSVPGHVPSMPPARAILPRDFDLVVRKPGAGRGDRRDVMKRRAIREITHASRAMFLFERLSAFEWEIFRSFRAVNAHAPVMLFTGSFWPAVGFDFGEYGMDEATAGAEKALDRVLAYLVYNLSRGCWRLRFDMARGVGAVCYAWAAEFGRSPQLHNAHAFHDFPAPKSAMANVVMEIMENDTVNYRAWQPGAVRSLDERIARELPLELIPRGLPQAVMDWASTGFEASVPRMDAFLADYIERWNAQ